MSSCVPASRGASRGAFASASAALAALFASLPVTETSAAVGWNWYPMPLVTSSSISAGVFPGGEGAQRPQFVAVDQTNGQNIIYGTDVGGAFRSTDGGATFTPANVGLEATGVVGVAFDPRNPNRVLLISDGGGDHWNAWGGVHLSTNAGASWSRRLGRNLNTQSSESTPKHGSSSQFGREQIAFDRSTYDAALNSTRTVYWVSEDDWTVTEPGGATVERPNGALYKSTNGGELWSVVATSDKYEGSNTAESFVAVHPTAGTVYIANKNGFFRSENDGVSFEKKLTGSFLGMQVSPAAGYENHVWLITSTQLLRSTDGGVSFQPVTTNLTGFQRLTVSPSNPQHMVASDGSWNRFYSTSGGSNWTASAESSTHSWVLSNGTADANRRCHAAFHPTNADIVFGLGVGDQLMRSTDKGANFSWRSNGINGLKLTSSFSFNSQNPDLLYIAAYDYNGALTTNGGSTWSLVNLEGGDNWGWVDSAYAVSSTLMFGANRSYDWVNKKVSDRRDLIVYSNAGGTITRTVKVTGLTGIAVSYGDPTDSQVLFCWNRRSADGGNTWLQMTDCDGVFAHHPTTKALYGAKGNLVKISTTKGASWTTLATMPTGNNVTDVSIDPVNNRIWVAAGDKLFKCDGPGFTPVQTLTGDKITSVAVDPRKPDTLYICGNYGTFTKMANGVRRSTDGGTSWHRLNNGAVSTDGGNCPTWVRVHPTTGVAYFGTNCYGLWTFEPPPPITGATIPAESDTFVHDGTKVANTFYQEDKVLAKNDGGAGYDREALLRFDLATITGTLQSARLRLFVRRIENNPAEYELCRTTDAWNETTVHWDNRPPLGAVIDTATVGIGGELVFDVTTYIANELAGDKKASFVVRRRQNTTENNTMLHISSKEAGVASEKPVLEYVVVGTPVGVNLLANPGFEANGAGTQTPSGWSESSPNATEYAAFVEANGGGIGGGAGAGTYHGSHWSQWSYRVTTFQTLTGLSNGTYTLRAKMRRSGGQTIAQMEASGFGGALRSATAANTGSTWQDVVVDNIQVTTGTCTIGFRSEALANQWMQFDAVSFTRN